MTNLLTLAVSILVFGVVILVHEFGHYITARRCGIQIYEFSIGMGPTLFTTQRSGIRYSVRLLPIGGYVSMAGEDGAETPPEQQAAVPQPPAQAPDGVFPLGQTKPFSEAKPLHRLMVMAAGACMNFVLGFVLLFVLVNAQENLASRQISQLDPDTLSAQTGLQVDDVILAVNGRACYVANDIVYELARTQDHTADITVRRSGHRVELTGVQFSTYTAEDGSEHMQLGFKVYPVKKTPLTILSETLRYTFYYGRLIVGSLADMMAGRVSINDLSGPVGIVSAIGEAVRYGWEDVFSLAALITINLGVFNLLPIPALDGGKMLLILVELVLRRPIPEKVQLAINAVGMMMLFSLMIFATWQDLLRLG